MKLPIWIVACVLPLLLSGCVVDKVLKKPAPVPEQEVAPAVPEQSAPLAVESKGVTMKAHPEVHPALPTPSETDDSKEEAAPEEQPKAAGAQSAQPTPTPAEPAKEAPAKPVRRARKPVVVPQPQKQPQSASTAGVSAGGQFSSGESDQETANAIGNLNHELNSIHRRLSSQEQTTAGRIREFLRKAKAALNSGDVEGARTLVAKARVLLGELTQ